MSVHDISLYDVLEINARRFPTLPALIDATVRTGESGKTTTFAELRDRVDQLGSGLAREGLRKGDRVAVLALNSTRFFELYLACAREGLVLVPVNWRWLSGEIAAFLARAEPRVLFADADNQNKVPSPDDVATIELRVEIDSDLEGRESGWRGFGEILHRRLRPPVTVGADDPLCIIATAAVDAIPRGAVLSHRNLLCSNVQEIGALTLTPADRNLVALPLFHIAGLGHALSFFHAGAANVVVPRFDANRAVEVIDSHAITHFSSFPPVLAQTLDTAAQAGSRLASLRWVTGLDAPATMQRLHQETSATFITGFGQAETTGFVTLQNARQKLGCAGKPSELCLVRLFDDYGQEAETGSSGEIAVRGPLVFLGYDGQPEATSYTFRNGWHHTGDVGRFDDEGFLFFVKRKAEKELIKPGGENVYPAEVEGALVSIAGVRQACVFGVPDPKWGEAIAAVAELEDGAELTLEQAREAVGTRIARFKRPHHLATTAALPRTADGVIDRDAVKAEYAGRFKNS